MPAKFWEVRRGIYYYSYIELSTENDGNMGYVKASWQKLGYILIPNRKITVYTSEQLYVHGVNYQIFELELAIIVHVLIKNWR